MSIIKFDDVMHEKVGKGSGDVMGRMLGEVTTEELTAAIIELGKKEEAALRRDVRAAGGAYTVTTAGETREREIPSFNPEEEED